MKDSIISSVENPPVVEGTSGIAPGIVSFEETESVEDWAPNEVIRHNAYTTAVGEVFWVIRDKIEYLKSFLPVLIADIIWVLDFIEAEIENINESGSKIFVEVELKSICGGNSEIQHFVDDNRRSYRDIKDVYFAVKERFRADPSNLLFKHICIDYISINTNIEFVESKNIDWYLCGYFRDEIYKILEIPDICVDSFSCTSVRARPASSELPHPSYLDIIIFVFVVGVNEIRSCIINHSSTSRVEIIVLIQVRIALQAKRIFTLAVPRVAVANMRNRLFDWGKYWVYTHSSNNQ